MNLKEWAKVRGVSYATAMRWYQTGQLPVPASKTGGLILVECDERGFAFGDVPQTSGKTVIYARVSSADQAQDLEHQVSRIARWMSSQGMPIHETVTEVGSALNGHRRKFLKLLRDPSVSCIVVEHRDRFARFGFEYVEAALSAQGRELIVIDDAEIDDDLVRDMTELMTSMCARIYGRSSAEHRASKAIKAAGEDG